MSSFTINKITTNKVTSNMDILFENITALNIVPSMYVMEPTLLVSFEMFEKMQREGLINEKKDANHE